MIPTADQYAAAHAETDTRVRVNAAIEQDWCGGERGLKRLIIGLVEDGMRRQREYDATIAQQHSDKAAAAIRMQAV